MIIGLCVDGDGYGGAEQSVANLVAATGDKVDFVLLGRPCVAVDELAKRVSCDVELIEGPTSNMAAEIRGFRTLFTRHRPDLLQVTLCNPGAALAPQIAAISLGIPTIAVEQLVRRLTPREILVKHAVSRLLHDHVSVGSESSDAVEEYFRLPKGSVRTIHNGVPVPVQTSPDVLRALVPQLADDPVLGFVGRLEDQKGLDRLLPVFASLEQGAHLVLIGDGSKRSALTQSARSLGVDDRVHFLGWQDDPTSLVAGFDAFVLPSRNEAFPLAMVEAMLLGVPVVVSAVGSVRDAVTDGETGFIMEGEDLSGFAPAIKALLEEPALAHRIGEAGRQIALSFTDTAMADLYHSMWQNPRGRILRGGSNELVASAKARALETVRR